MLADLANRYIDANKPWIIIKDEKRKNEVQEICTQGLNMFRSLMIYLSPVNPIIAKKSRVFFNEDNWQWSDASTPLLKKELAKFSPLLTRVDPKQVNILVDKSNDI